MSGHRLNEGRSVPRAIGTGSSEDQVLYIRGALLPPVEGSAFPGVVQELRGAGPDAGGLYGPYYGQVRVLDDRLDYFFDTGSGCFVDKAPLCRFRLVVADGKPVFARSGKTRTLDSIAFGPARTLLDYRPCDPAGDPVNCYFNLYGCYDDRDCLPNEDFVYATLNVKFVY